VEQNFQKNGSKEAQDTDEKLQPKRKKDMAERQAEKMEYQPREQP